MLKSEAIKYGESISFCDLRWGINTGDLDSEEGARKVLDVCLDEIDRCKPPMVVILGDRYGWIPSETLTKSAADRKQIELEDLQISVTALEIAYGALSTPERCRQTLFYFRHIESDCPKDYAVEDSEHENKLNRLKARIEALTEGKIKHYTVRWNGEALEGILPFAEMLANDLTDILLPEWKQKEMLTPFERERNTHWSFIAEKNTMFSARYSLVQRYYDDLTQGGKHLLIIKAPSGSGKSMLFSSLALKLRGDGYDVLPFISGLTAESNDSIDLLRNTVCFLEELLCHPNGQTTPDFSDSAFEGNASEDSDKGEKTQIDRLRERLFGLCVECERANKRVVILVDAVDQLAASEHRDNLIFLPERLSKHVKFVMTCLPELPIGGRAFETLLPMDQSEKKEVIDGILKSHNRELENKVIRKMVATRASGNPLFLSLLIQRLLMMNRDDFIAIKQSGDGMSAITTHQLELIASCPDSLQAMSAALLTEAGKRINDPLVRKVAEFLAVSRHGLRREDLAALLGEDWNALDFAHLITYMDEDFVERDDGRFDFSHKCIREGFLELCRDVSEVHRKILTHLKSLPNDDPVKMEEIVYHCISLNHYPFTMQYLCENISSPLAMGFAAKLLLSQSVTDNGAWMRELFSAYPAAERTEFFDFLFHYYFSVPYSHAEAARVQAGLSEEACALCEQYCQKDVLADVIRMVEAHQVAAETYRAYRISSYYSEGENKAFWAHHEQIFRICEASLEIFDSDALREAMAMSALVLMQSVRGKAVRRNEFDAFLKASGLSRISPDYAEKAIELLERLVQNTSSVKLQLDLTVAYITMAGYSYFQKYDKTRNYNFEALCKSPYYQKAALLLSTIDASDIDRKYLQRLSECYMYCGTYFVSMHDDGKEAGCSYLEKGLQSLELLCAKEPSFDHQKTYLYALSQSCKYCVAIQRNYAHGTELLKKALRLSENLYLQSQNADILSLYISLQGYRHLIVTDMGRDSSNIVAELQIFKELHAFFSTHYEGYPRIKAVCRYICHLLHLSQRNLLTEKGMLIGLIYYLLSITLRPIYRKQIQAMRFLPCEKEYLSKVLLYFRNFGKARTNICSRLLLLWYDELLRPLKADLSKSKS